MSSLVDAGMGRASGDFDPLLTPQEVVELLQHRITAKTLSNWRSEGEGRGPNFKKLGNRIYYLRSVVLAWSEHDFASTQDYKAMREARSRDLPKPKPKAAPLPEAVGPAAHPADALLADFDDTVAQLREAIVARLVELANSSLPPKRPRGRPRGSRNKVPRRAGGK